MHACFTSSFVLLCSNATSYFMILMSDLSLLLSAFALAPHDIFVVQSLRTFFMDVLE
ncbi:uncharacterized protein J3R85_003157 [Psidium guajava]|nr:uncharacterized protein J3R85_003157 [Psidium guajava]